MVHFFDATGRVARLLIFAVFAGPALATADDLEAASGDVILSITGRIALTNSDGTADLDRGFLESLDPAVIETTTIWTDGVQRFTGVPLHALLEAVGADGTTLVATAINDYSIEIPVADAVPDGPIIAYQQNGEEMSVREKGPLWIVYPFDSKRDYQTEQIYTRSIWQLVSIEVLP